MKSKLWKVLIHKDSLLLIATLVWLWFTLTMLVDINYDVQKLQPHTGKVSDVQVVITRMKNKLLYKDTTWELQIALIDEPQYFTVPTKNNFNNITAAISLGDTITIYTKDKVLGIFGFGDNHTIAHLVRHPTNEVLIDFAKKQQSNSSIVFLPALATVVFLIWYIIKVRRRLWWDLGGYEEHREMRTTGSFVQ